jgi:UDP-N-acetylmuramate dehydrogenase
MIQENVLLAKYTTFKIGGPAKFFAETDNESDLLSLLDLAKKNNWKFFILGGGSNVLISDDGFDGLVIKMKTARDKFWAGNSLASLVGDCQENFFSGLEWAVGIPGTIGGAIRGNAGAYGGCVGSIIETVRVLNLKNGEIENYSCEKCQFEYRSSIFKKNEKLVVLSVALALKKENNRDVIREKMHEILQKRCEKIPQNFSAGSFFQNPLVTDRELISQFERDSGTKNIDGKIPAGWLIDEVGLRGKKIGGVMISENHANFIVNMGTGTAQEVVILSGIIKQKVRHKFHIQLKEEVVYVGF